MPPNTVAAGLPPAFLGFPTTEEVFESTTACKARLQGFSLGQGFAVAVGKSNKGALRVLVHPSQYRDWERPLA
jgi:hypothetical protein